MTVEEALLAEADSINTFRYRQVEKAPQGSANTTKVAQKSANASTTSQDVKSDDSIVSDIVKARQIISKSLASGGDGGVRSDERVQKLEARVAELEGTVKKLTDLVSKLTLNPTAPAPKAAAAPVKAQAPQPPKQQAKPAPSPADDDDDVDLFGSDDEVDEEAEKLKQERLKAYAEKKSKKPGPIAKSNVILDVKPWDDETDMKALEDAVRTIQMDGLVWGVSKLVPLAYGIRKLQIVCVVEDEKVSIDELTEKIEEFGDYVQSVDIAAFQKI